MHLNVIIIRETAIFEKGIFFLTPTRTHSHQTSCNVVNQQQTTNERKRLQTTNNTDMFSNKPLNSSTTTSPLQHNF